MTTQPTFPPEPVLYIAEAVSPEKIAEEAADEPITAETANQPHDLVVDAVRQTMAGVAGDALRANVMVELRAPKVTPEVKQFWKTFLPATLGSAGTQRCVVARGITT